MEVIREKGEDISELVINVNKGVDARLYKACFLSG